MLEVSWILKPVHFLSSSKLGSKDNRNNVPDVIAAVIQSRIIFASELVFLSYCYIGHPEPELGLKAYREISYVYLGWDSNSRTVRMLDFTVVKSPFFFFFLFISLSNIREICSWHAWLNLFLQIYLYRLLWQTQTIYRKVCKHFTCVLEVEVGSITINIKPDVSCGLQTALWQFGKNYWKYS